MLRWNGATAEARMDSHSSTAQGSATSSALFSAGASSAFTNLQPRALPLSFFYILNLQSISLYITPLIKCRFGRFQISHTEFIEPPACWNHLHVLRVLPAERDGMHPLCGSVVLWKSGPVLSIQEHLQISQSSSNSGFMLCTKLPCHHANCRPEPCLNPLHHVAS